MKLQYEKSTISHARPLHLSPTSTIVENVLFESESAKIQSGKESKITTCERKTLKHIEKRSSKFYKVVIAQDISLVETVLRKRILTKLQMLFRM